MNEITLDSIVRQVNEMPVLPERMNKIIKIVEDPDSTVEDLEREILKIKV